ncbi:TetR/AcrR family transcriptional regulator [Polaromonas sp. SM01]|uniref:TetR/AcrR family transcriptional regulator n=1 Tax=Polaromonas sp. SM01 TaxID=3085630 RepID=UPI0029818062|nr:TetR/AcrR family transcriptional regulator [Polaromonas sp. SM01]MDW5441752.1 TetR/AcrR family transcriptional regulator [Polaromonas sp. SM01]
MSNVFSQPPALGARRQPTQQRSQERLDRILAAAKELIATTGSDRVKMSEIAALADISIGSLYQYFPDKSAVIRTLAQRYNAESHRCIAEALAGVSDLESLHIAYDGLVDQYYELLLAEPVMRDIWSGMQADKQLTALELEESRACGALLAAAMQRASPGADAEKIASSAFLIWQLGEATMRLAMALEREEGEVLVATYKRMSWREMAEP